MSHTLGISVHTGWAACVVVGGSLRNPQVVANEILEILGQSERFCFHLAADMDYAAAETWIARVKERAVVNARRGLSNLLAPEVLLCVLVAKEGAMGHLREVLRSHARIHAAEGLFYRDVMREACSIPVRIISPKSLNPSTVGKFAPAPWGRDQKLAALAAWSVMDE
jgi:hypothetical protein